jgi:hypothetical protein
VDPKWWDVVIALEVGYREFSTKASKRPSGSEQGGGVTDTRPSTMRHHIELLKEREAQLKGNA